MKELVVISGKGGTGKTSMVASFATLARNAVLADCDVDAADLHLILEPHIERQDAFSGGKKARIIADNCIVCNRCVEECRFDAIRYPVEKGGRKAEKPVINPLSCEGCGLCMRLCPVEAISFDPVVNGQMYVSSTRNGPMVHARLGIAEGNSGKLVALIREEARRIAENDKRDFIIVDGSPGIGCPVVSSITGADGVLIVTEPTLSGRHDLLRVAGLARHFRIKTMVCVNKWDLNPAMADLTEEEARQNGLMVAGRVRYDPAITMAQIMKKSVVEYTDGAVSDDIKEVWKNVLKVIAPA
jgi:MinD superfamily P-loop ATPase